MRPSLLVAAAALLAASCSSLWDRANRIPFQEDVEEVLATSGVPVGLSDCHMEGTTRTGNCVLKADPAQVEAIASTLNMSEAQPLATGDDSPFPTFLRDSPCLVDYPSSALYEVLAYFITGRPDPLRLADGGQFEYMLIVVDPANHDACIQASYSYG